MKNIFHRCLPVALAFVGAMTASAADSAVESSDTIPYSETLHCDPVLSGIRVGTSFGLNVGVTELLKNTIHEMRPDRSGNNSFPSRHTSWAYAISAIASNELYSYSPWWVLGFHAASAGVGLQRTWTSRHYPSDVLAGAAIGIGSAALGSWLGEFFYSGRFRGIWPHGVAAEFKASLDVATEALFPFTAIHSLDGIAYRTGDSGFGASMNLTLPVSARLGLLATACMQSLAMECSGSDGSGNTKPYVTSDPLNLMAFSLGGLARLTPDGASPFALDYDLTVGVAHTFNYSTMPAVSFMLRTSLSASWRMTRSFEAGARAGYQLLTIPEAASAMTLSLFTRAVF